ENEDEMVAAEKWVHQQKQAGLDFKMLDREDLKNESKYFADDLYGGLECASDSTVNPYMLTYAMFHEAKKYGTTIHTNTEVTNNEKKQDDNFKLETTNSIYTAKIIVNAC